MGEIDILGSDLARDQTGRLFLFKRKLERVQNMTFLIQALIRN